MRLTLTDGDRELRDADTGTLIPQPWPPDMGPVCYTLTAPRLYMKDFVIDSLVRI